MRRLHAAAPRAGASFEVIFADGRSSDGTPEEIMAQAAALGLGNVSVEASAGRGGCGADILRGLERAQGDILAWTHADLQCDLADVFAALAAYRHAGGGKILVKGERQGRPAFDQFFTSGMGLFNRLVTGHAVSDINAQPKLFPRGFYEAQLATGAPADFSLDLHALNRAAADGYRIIGFPVVMRDRTGGTAKGGGGGLGAKLKLARRTASYILSQGRA